MKLVRARVSGFCMGVRRAVTLAAEAAAGDADVYTLGPLIHNTRVLESLGKQGIKILEDREFSAVPRGSTVIIRAHGVPPEVEKELVERGFRVVDATCPHVKASQEKARDYACKGYRIFLAGEKDHGEIIGIRGYAEAGATPGEGGCYIVGNAAEAENAAFTLAKQGKAKTVLIGQTTISQKEYSSIAETIGRYFQDIEVVDTICGATAQRQDALRELCAVTDAVIIAGGRESANTRRLLFLARELGKPSWLVETPQELPSGIANYKTVGIAAGASAPEDLMAEIEASLKTLPV